MDLMMKDFDPSGTPEENSPSDGVVDFGFEMGIVDIILEQEADECPPADEFFIGCEVQLKPDLDTVMRNQSKHYEEPILRYICEAQLKGIVKRHQGEYSYVVFKDSEQQRMIGVTVYRASFKAKVKAKPPSAEQDMDPFSQPIYDEKSSSNPIARTPVDEHTGAKNDSLSDERSLSFDKKRYKNKGNKAFAKKAYPEAIEAYGKALRLEDTIGNALILSNRSAAYLAQGRQFAPQALADAKQCIEIAPWSTRGFVRAGNALRAMRHFEAAADMYQRAQDLAPHDKEVRAAAKANLVSLHFHQFCAVTHEVKVLSDLNGVLHVYIKNPCQIGDVILVDRPRATCTLRHPMAPSIASCGHCHRTLLKAEPIITRLQQLKPDVSDETIALIREHFPAADSMVHCHDTCGERYCCDDCRSAAWEAYHCIECGAKGMHKRTFTATQGFARTERAIEETPELMYRVDLTLRIAAICLAQISKTPVGRKVELPSTFLAMDERPKTPLWIRNIYDYFVGRLSERERCILTLSTFHDLYLLTDKTVQLTTTPWPTLMANIEAAGVQLTDTQRDELDVCGVLCAGTAPEIQHNILSVFAIARHCQVAAEGQEGNTAIIHTNKLRAEVSFVATENLPRGGEIILRKADAESMSSCTKLSGQLALQQSSTLFPEFTPRK